MTSQPNEAAIRKEAGTSYWDAPEVDESIQGKTLSTLDLSALAFNHPNEHQDQRQPKEGDDQKERRQQNSNTSGATAAATGPSPTSTVITAEEPADENNKYTSSSPYWDAPKEQYLEGKTLSTLDMSLLQANHPDEKQSQINDGSNSQNEEEKQQQQQQTIKKNDSGYWDAAPIENSLQGKTLSTLSMTAMNTNHADGNDITGGYWDAPEEEKLKGKTLSTIDVATLATNSNSSCGDTSTSTDGDSAPSYWDDAPIDESLRGKTLSKVDMTEMSKQHVDANKASMSASPYWDWNFKAAKKTLSNLSLKSLRRGSGKDTVVMDDNFNVVPSRGSSKWVSSSNNNNNNNSPKNQKPVKSITNKVHKLRDSWRKSFQRLSTNTLDQLDESGRSTGSAKLMGKRMFKSRNVLDVSGGSLNSQGSADGITF